MRKRHQTPVIKDRKNSSVRQSYRIAIVSNASWYTYNFRLGLLRRLRDLGFAVSVIAPKDHATPLLIHEGFEFIHLPLPIYGTNPFGDLEVLRQLRNIYRAHRFDFIFHYTAKPNIYGTLAAAWCGIPSIAVTTGLGLMREEHQRLSGRMLRLFYRLAARLSREVWFLNEDDRRYFLDRHMVGKQKTFLLPSEGVDITYYRPLSSHRPATERKQIRFLFASRIVWAKGVGEYVAAARRLKARHPELVFDIAGFVVPEHPDAVSVTQLQQWHREGVINYLGELDDIRPVLADADCVVLPSYFEGVPRILLEAAAMARPIIATTAVGCREVVDHGVNGLLCRPYDVDDLVQAIETFCALSPAERESMGLAGRKKAIRQFDEALVVEHYLERLARYLPVPGRKSPEGKHRERKLFDGR